MLWKIAWRNLWRNKRRSVIILVSVVVGMVAMMLTDALYTGMIRQVLTNQVSLEVGHIQIHRKGFHDNPSIKLLIERPDEVEAVIRQHPEVLHHARRVLTYGILSSSYNSSGVNIVSVEPEAERQITLISKSIVQGRYLKGEAHEVLIGEGLARKLEVSLGDKVVAMASRLDGSIGSDVFRIVGIYRTFDSEHDKVTMYIPLETAQHMLGLGDAVSEFVLMVEDVRQVDAVRDSLRNQLPPMYETLSYRDVLPLLVYQSEAMAQWMMIYYVIIGIALVFGIVNTMLMAVFERVQEIGVLKAIGMPNWKVLAMILLESTILGLLGTVIGIGVGMLIYWPLSHSGLNLSVFSESLASFGVSAVIYPVMDLRILLSAGISIPIVALVGAIYPAIKAVRFEPVEAMRYI